MKLTPDLQEDFDLIVDTFTGADGGLSFMAFKAMMDHLDKKTDDASRQLLDITVNFARFLRVCNKHFDVSLDE